METKIEGFPLDEVIGIAKRLSTLYKEYAGFVAVDPYHSGEVHFTEKAFKALFHDYSRSEEPDKDGDYYLKKIVDGVEVYAYERIKEEAGK